jgi:hypothetical protein
MTASCTVATIDPGVISCIAMCLFDDNDSDEGTPTGDRDDSVVGASASVTFNGRTCFTGSLPHCSQGKSYCGEYAGRHKDGDTALRHEPALLLHVLVQLLLLRRVAAKGLRVRAVRRCGGPPSGRRWRSLPPQQVAG